MNTKMSIKSRRIIALLLCFLMVFSAMPVSAFAVEDTMAQVVEQSESDVVVSPDDVTVDVDEDTTTEDNPTADADNEPVVEDETPVVEEETPVVEDETPAVEDETPVVEEEPPVVEDETPAAEDETPAVEDETPVVEDETPVVEDETPVVEEEVPVLGGTITDQYGIMLLNEVALLTTEPGTLGFGTNLSTEPYCMSSSTAWNAPSTSLAVTVTTYAPAGGEAAALPDGTKVTYQWYSSTDDVVDNDDTALAGQTYANYTISSRNATPSTTYYYVKATATIDDVEYSATSNVACVKIGAANISVKLTVNDKGVLGTDKNATAAVAKAVTVVDSNYDGKHTYDEALQTAHSTYKTADDYATTEGQYGL